MYERPLFVPAGDQALVVELGNEISPEVNRLVRNLALAIERAAIEGVLDIVPTYRSLLVCYEPMAISAGELQAALEQVEQTLDETTLEKPRIVHIPTLYGGAYGPDIDFVAEQAGLTTAEVIRLHSTTDYLVYMMGFSPGFPYLGGLCERLATPRLEKPRPEIPAGSVGIAGSQTGVYPLASPGGWRLIGRTPLKLFDAHRETPALLTAGDYVRFVPVSTEDEYGGIEQLVRAGKYDLVTEVGA